MKPHEFKALLDRYSKGQCTPEEEVLIETWYSNIQNSPQEQDAHKDFIEEKLWAKINPDQTAQPIKRRSFLTFTRVAASLLLLAMVGWGIYVTTSTNSSQETSTIIPQKRERSPAHFAVRNTKNIEESITLSDGSIVTLKPQSELKVSDKFATDSREVFLTGEAFFKVTHNPSRPFFVYANEVVTRVLGTSFTVKAYDSDKEIIVAVKTGKVSVYTNHDSSAISPDDEEPQFILTPNQRAVYDREKDRVSRELVEKPELVLPKPTLFRMQYDGAPVTKIFEALEENYGVDIDYDEELLKACVLTTSMSDEGLYERIEVICKAINAEYKVTDATIKINSRGCQ